MYLDLAGRKIKLIEKDFEDGNLGQFRSEPELTIQIKTKMPKNQRSRVLRHELTHALLWITGSGFNLTLDVEEPLVLALEYGMEQIIRESKK